MSWLQQSEKASNFPPDISVPSKLRVTLKMVSFPIISLQQDQLFEFQLHYGVYHLKIWGRGA